MFSIRQMRFFIFLHIIKSEKFALEYERKDRIWSPVADEFGLNSGE